MGSSLTDNQEHELKIQKLGENLILLDPLGQGGMAQVHRALHFGADGFRKIVAVKRISEKAALDKSTLEHFRREMQLCSQLRHPNIAEVYTNGQYEGGFYLVMEFLEGKSLHQVLRKCWDNNVEVPLPFACFIIAETAKGLAYAHDLEDFSTGKKLNIIHRDISPHNIMVGYEGYIKLVDFGVAKADDHTDLTSQGVVKGKASYIAPELTNGSAPSPRSDIFSLGLCFYELLCGHRLFQGDIFKIIENIRLFRFQGLNEKLAPIHASVQEILQKMLHEDPSHRYLHISDVDRDLSGFLAREHPSFHSMDLKKFLGSLFEQEKKNERLRREHLNELISDITHEFSLSNISRAKKLPTIRADTPSDDNLETTQLIESEIDRFADALRSTKKTISSSSTKELPDVKKKSFQNIEVDRSFAERKSFSERNLLEKKTDRFKVSAHSSNNTTLIILFIVFIFSVAIYVLY